MGRLDILASYLKPVHLVHILSLGRSSLVSQTLNGWYQYQDDRVYQETDSLMD